MTLRAPQEHRRSPAERAAICVIGGLLLIAAFAPFLSNSRPFTMTIDGARHYPLFAALTALDILWPTAVIAAWLAMGWRGQSTRRRRMIALGVAALGICTAAIHDTKVDPRRYQEELRLRERIASLDQRILQSDPMALVDLKRLALTASAVRDASLAIEDRIIALEGKDDQSVLTSLAANNSRALVDLRSAVAAPNPHSADHSSTEERNIAPSRNDNHWLGTDPDGRDLLAVLIHGTRTAFTVAIPVVLITGLLGLIIGGLAGLRGGMTDRVLSRLIELVMCLPVLVLLVLFAAWLPQGPGAMIVILSCVFWTHPARLVRAEARRVAQEDFVLSAQVLGATTWHTLRCHIIPHSLPPLIISASFTLGWAIMVESSLSFLGLGEAGTASWGDLLALARRDLGDASHTALWAGAALFAVVYSANILGDRATRSVR